MQQPKRLVLGSLFATALISTACGPLNAGFEGATLDGSRDQLSEVEDPPDPMIDTEFPSAMLTAPAEGSTLSATVVLTAIATDNFGVVGVQFLIDKQAVGVEDTTAPYATPLNTEAYDNGEHVLNVQARDAAGHTTMTADVVITISNGGP